MTLAEYKTKKEELSEKHTSIFSKDSTVYATIAIDEIISNIIMTHRTEKHYYSSLEQLGQLICKELNVNEEKIDWDKLEEYRYEIESSMATFYLDAKQVTKILSNINVKKATLHNDLDLNCKAFDISLTDNIILDIIKGELKPHNKEVSKKLFLV